MQNIWFRVRGGPLVVLLLTLLLAAAAGVWLDDSTAEAAPLRQGDPPPGDHSGQRCSECHLDFNALWESGVHAIAYSRSSFQEYWEDRNRPTSCLDCHTTHYQPSTNTYFAEDVVCEACHGLNPADHPPAEITLPLEIEMCGRCHEGTFQELRNSPHAVTDVAGGIVCATCHDPHSQQLRFPSIDELCLSCHQTPPQDFAHTSHLGHDLHCGGCHMYRDPDLGPCVASLCPTGHTMAVDTLACNDCHEDLNRRLETFTALTDPERLVLERDSLQAQVADLEAQLAAVQPAPEPEARVNFIQLTQGLIIGLGVGLSLAWVLSRRGNGNNGNNKKNGNGPSEAHPPQAETSSEGHHE